MFYALKIAYRADPLRALLDLFVKFLYRAFVVFYNVFFIGYVLKTIENSNHIKQIWILVGISIFIMVSYDFLAAWYYNTYKPYADKNVYKKYKELIYKKASEVDLEFYEDTEFYNRYTKSSQEICQRFDGVLGGVSDMVTDIVMNGYLFVTVFQLDALATGIYYSLLFNAHFYFQAAKAVMQSQDTRRLRIEGTVMEGSKPRKAAALYEDRRIPGAGLFQEWCRSLPVPIERKPSIELF